MGKIWIVMRSEFVRRVRSKWFIIGTLLAPVGMLAITMLPAAITYMAVERGERTVAVLDESGRLFEHFPDDPGVRFKPADISVSEARVAVEAGIFDGYLLLPSTLAEGIGTATYVSSGGAGMGISGRLNRIVNRAVERHRLLEQDASPEIMAVLEQRVEVRTSRIAAGTDEARDSMASSLAGYLMGFVIYMSVFIYGAMVMHGVIEEKTSRVVEIMASSVRPFELLMGKVLGIGAMGLFQMILWGILLIAGAFVIGGVAGIFIDPATLTADVPGAEVPDIPGLGSFSIPWTIVFWFFLFFLGGYLLYASLFASVGAAVEQSQDAQSLMFPVTIPIIIPILFISYVIEEPNAPLSVALSLVPFFSPILMMVRLGAANVPLYEVIASFVLLIAGFLVAIWMSARIYRIGILMYGKKASFRDLARWVRM
jgi:ABC-2 type transport system permease protein